MNLPPRLLSGAGALLMRGLLDLFFPPRCPGCRAVVAGPEPFCRPCAETLCELPRQRCPGCAEPEVVGLCAHCRASPPAFELALAPYLHGGALADAIHRLKYEDRPQLARPLARLLLPHVAEQLSWCEVLAPISLHPNRLRQRGYDQALLIARALGRLAGREVIARAVRRVRDTPPQVGRDRFHREQNVRGAFVGGDGVAGRRVLLVDDVLTTGATAHAASLALREAGAGAVRVVALARAG
jgi:ComF family protein